jgi:hypothetical protein
VQITLRCGACITVRTLLILSTASSSLSNSYSVMKLVYWFDGISAGLNCENVKVSTHGERLSHVCMHAYTHARAFIHVCTRLQISQVRFSGFPCSAFAHRCASQLLSVAFCTDIHLHVFAVLVLALDRFWLDACSTVSTAISFCILCSLPVVPGVCGQTAIA